MPGESGQFWTHERGMGAGTAGQREPGSHTHPHPGTATARMSHHRFAIVLGFLFQKEYKNVINFLIKNRTGIFSQMIPGNEMIAFPR